jgi:hypothetical protein
MPAGAQDGIPPSHLVMKVKQRRESNPLHRVLKYAKIMLPQVVGKVDKEWPVAVVDAMLGSDVYKFDEVRQIAAELGCNSVNGRVWSHAIRNALDRAGVEAAVEIFNKVYDETNDGFVPYIAVNSITSKLLQRRDLALVHSEDLHQAVTILRRQLQRGRPPGGSQDNTKLMTSNILAELSSQFAYPSREACIQQFIQLHLEHKQPICDVKTDDAVFIEIITSESHDEALSKLLAQPGLSGETMKRLSGTLVRLRFADATVMPWEVFSRLLAAFKARGFGDDPNLLVMYTRSVAISAVKTISFDEQPRELELDGVVSPRLPVRAQHLEHSRRVLRKVEELVVETKFGPRSREWAVFAALVSAYSSMQGSKHLSPDVSEDLTRVKGLLAEASSGRAYSRSAVLTRLRGVRSADELAALWTETLERHQDRVDDTLWARYIHACLRLRQPVAAAHAACEHLVDNPESEGVRTAVVDLLTCRLEQAESELVSSTFVKTAADPRTWDQLRKVLRHKSFGSPAFEDGLHTRGAA